MRILALETSCDETSASVIEHTDDVDDAPSHIILDPHIVQRASARPLEKTHA